MKWTMYALLNYSRMMAVLQRRKDAVEYAAKLVDGGKNISDEMLKNGSFNIIKVEVREIAAKRRGK